MDWFEVLMWRYFALLAYLESMAVTLSTCLTVLSSNCPKFYSRTSKPVLWIACFKLFKFLPDHHNFTQTCLSRYHFITKIKNQQILYQQYTYTCLENLGIWSYKWIIHKDIFIFNLYRLHGVGISEIEQKIKQYISKIFSGKWKHLLKV